MTDLEELANEMIKRGRWLANAWSNSGIWPKPGAKRHLGDFVDRLHRREPYDGDLPRAIEAMRDAAAAELDAIHAGFGAFALSGRDIREDIRYRREMAPFDLVIHNADEFVRARDAYLDLVAAQRAVKDLGLRE